MPFSCTAYQAIGVALLLFGCTLSFLSVLLGILSLCGGIYSLLRRGEEVRTWFLIVGVCVVSFGFGVLALHYAPIFSYSLYNGQEWICGPVSN